jgi:hypothetical protein
VRAQRCAPTCAATLARFVAACVPLVFLFDSLPLPLVVRPTLVTSLFGKHARRVGAAAVCGEIGCNYHLASLAPNK